MVRRYGGEVVLLPYTGHSTSRILAAARTSQPRRLAGPASIRTETITD